MLKSEIELLSKSRYGTEITLFDWVVDLSSGGGEGQIVFLQRFYAYVLFDSQRATHTPLKNTRHNLIECALTNVRVS